MEYIIPRTFFVPENRKKASVPRMLFVIYKTFRPYVVSRRKTDGSPFPTGLPHRFAYASPLCQMRIDQRNFRAILRGRSVFVPQRSAIRAQIRSHAPCSNPDRSIGSTDRSLQYRYRSSRRTYSRRTLPYSVCVSHGKYPGDAMRTRIVSPKDIRCSVSASVRRYLRTTRRIYAVTISHSALHAIDTPAHAPIQYAEIACVAISTIAQTNAATSVVHAHAAKTRVLQ